MSSPFLSSRAATILCASSSVFSGHLFMSLRAVIWRSNLLVNVKIAHLHCTVRSAVQVSSLALRLRFTPLSAAPLAVTFTFSTERKIAAYRQSLSVSVRFCIDVQSLLSKRRASQSLPLRGHDGSSADPAL